MLSTILVVLVVILGLLVALAAIVGCFFPVIPGPPLSLLSLVILSMAKGWDTFQVWVLVVMTLFMIIVTVLDYLVPIMGAKKLGASKLGIWGSVIGMLVGLIFFPPWGIFIGAFLGALVGELIVSKGFKQALLAGWGIFLGNMAALGLKLGYTVTALLLYVAGIFFNQVPSIF